MILIAISTSVVTLPVALIKATGFYIKTELAHNIDMTTKYTTKYKVTFTHFNEGREPHTSSFPQLFNTYNDALACVREDANSWIEDEHDHFLESTLTLHNDTHNDSIVWAITEIQM